MAFVRRWWFLGAAIVGFTLTYARLDAKVDQKADSSAVERVAEDVRSMKVLMEDMDARQRSFFCNNQPAWCR
ncbi:MAG TPA: hypothetical protein VIU40_02795 [Geobacteraceae bacterium]